MNDLTLTRPGEENTCSAGLGWLATCREGWEFLQQEGCGDGGLEEVEEEDSRSPCVCGAVTLMDVDVLSLLIDQTWLLSRSVGYIILVV